MTMPLRARYVAGKNDETVGRAETTIIGHITESGTESVRTRSRQLLNPVHRPERGRAAAMTCAACSAGRPTCRCPRTLLQVTSALVRIFSHDQTFAGPGNVSRKLAEQCG